MMTNATSRPGDFTIRLRDGRRMQSLEVGKSDGVPLFHFHGNGSSRLEVLMVQAMAEHLGVRLMSLASDARIRSRATGCSIGPMMW
jgi:hypothetical protein